MVKDLFPPEEAYTGLLELRAFKDAQLRFVIGADEAGRGCLAGPLHAGAVALGPGASVPGVTDSKQLRAAARERALQQIETLDLPRALACISVDTIDRINILESSLLGMAQAAGSVLDQLRTRHPDLQPSQVLLLVDGNMPLRGWTRCPQKAVVQGDFLSLAVACASIVAKVTRDRAMQQLHQEFPQYHWDENKAYGTPSHLAALRAYGPCPHHRMTYAPCRDSEK
jgi:ribonuclease HII